jgi:hypothetical protein
VSRGSAPIQRRLAAARVSFGDHELTLNSL